MKKAENLLILLSVMAVFLITSCGNKVDEFTEMATHLEGNGDFINRAKGGAPAMIKAPEVLENIDTYHIIDIRGGVDFANGHIKGAVNIKTKNLIEYFETLDNQKYKKIVMVCYSGQSAGFATSALRLIGYDNVYDLKWGMASWNQKFAVKWKTNSGNKFENLMEKDANPKAPKGDYPVIKTRKSTGKDIAMERAKDVLNEGFGTVKVTADQLFKSPEKYYIVNYWPGEKYLAGHVPTAINYLPKKTLKTTAELATLPTDKPIVIYCYTGQHSAFVVAYLRMLGYDARTLLYGANSFMNAKLLENKWTAFSEKEIHDYEFITSELPETEDDEEAGGC